MKLIYTNIKRWLITAFAILLVALPTVYAGDFPDIPNPPRLVNDFAGMLNGSEQDRLENKLEGFARTTSTQITIVTIKSLGDYDVSDYAIQLFNKWGIGQKGKDNGVLMLVSLNDRKAWIVTGKGLEGVLTDAKTSRVFRNVLRPAFREGNYYQGLDESADAIIAITKGEYTADDNGADNSAPGAAIIVFLIVVIIIISIFRRGGGRGGGGYRGGRGMGDFATGWLLGELLSGGSRGGGGWGSGGGSWGGGGFGGFGGGSSGGGGAGGSW